MFSPKTFFSCLVKSFSSLDYYGEVLKAPFWFSLKFFYGFFFIYAIAATVIFTLQLAGPLNRLLKILPDKLSQIYPAELEIIITDGEVSINQPEPYFISVKQMEQIIKEWQKETVLGASSQKLENLLVIDTSASVDDIVRYQTAALLTKDKLVFVKDNGWQVTPLQNLNLTVNQSLIQSIIDVVIPYLKYIAPVLSVAAFFAIFSYAASSNLIFLVFFALFIFLTGKLMSFPVSYAKSFQLGLHLTIIPAVVFGLLSLVGHSVSFPFLRTIFLSLLVVLIFRRLKSLAI